MPKAQSQQPKGQNLINGAMILVISTVVVKLIGAIFKIPLTNLIGATGRGYFSTAYEIYVPVYSISMAGLPTAVSKMVSENMALGRLGNVKAIRSVAAKLFLFTGTAGTALLFAVAYPYAKYVSGTMQVLPAILMVAPSVFFCCLMASYRGYYEGMQNMKPTAYSQVIEAVTKLALGLALAYGFIQYGVSTYQKTGMVLGQSVESLDEAMSLMYPYAAAAAILGVTLGTVFGLVYLMLFHRKNRLRNVKPPDMNQRQILRRLFVIAVPMVAGALVQSISNLIDTATIQWRLESAISGDVYGIIDKMYAQSLTISGTQPEDVKTYLFGVYNTALDIKNLVPAVTMALGISALPAMSRAWTLGNKKEMGWIVNSVLKFSMVIGLPVGFGMAAIPGQILQLMYPSNLDMIPIAAPIVRIYGIFMILFAVSTPLVSILQSIGRADAAVKSMAIGAVVKIALNYFLVGNPVYNINGAAISSIICYLIVVFYNMVVLKKEVKVDFKIWQTFIKPALCSAACGLSAYGLMGLASRFMGNTLATVLSVVGAALIYLVLLIIMRILTKEDIVLLFKREKMVKTLEKFRLIR